MKKIPPGLSAANTERAIPVGLAVGPLWKSCQFSVVHTKSTGVGKAIAIETDVGAHPNVKRFTTNVALSVVKRGLMVPVPLEPAE